jgi:oligopeptide transport system substrate-binding protein
LALLRPFVPVAAILLLALAGCGQKAHRPPCPPGKVCLEYGLNAEPLTLDPQRAEQVPEAIVVGDLMMGLTTEGPDASVQPGMAERWETSADGLVWTFHLRPAVWSDGAPVRAQDFVFAYRRVLDPRTGSAYAYLLDLLKNGRAANAGKAPLETVGARALDDRTLQLTLEHPAPYLPMLLKHLSWYPAPEHAVRRYGDDWVRPGRYVSNGPYTLAAWRLGDHLTLVKNPRFFDAARVCVDRVNYYPAPDYVAAERRVAAGELDVASFFQSNRLQHIRATMPGYARPNLWLITSYLTFNTRDAGPLQDRRVRQALSEAIDREFITGKLLRAGQLPAYGFVPPGTANAAAPARPAWSRADLAARQAEARSLLAQAGYDSRRPLEITLSNSSSPEAALLAEAIQADWRAVGVRARITQSEGQILLSDLRQRNFQAALATWAADYNDPLTFLAIFKSDTGAQNYGDYRSPAFDALLAAADREVDAGRRAGLLARADQVLADDVGVAPIYFSVARPLVNPKVTGWVDNIENWHRARWLCVKRG